MPNQAMDFLGGQKIVGSAETSIEIASRVLEGLPWSSFESIETTLNLSTKDLADLLLIPTRTLDRRKIKGRLEALESDRLFRLARVLAHAVEVFGSLEKARDWLTSENRSLDQTKPLQLLTTDVGAQEIDDMLGRIAQGIFG